MEQSEAIITVVIPVRNRADVVTRTLDSVLAQRVRPLRLIVVDNGSTDTSQQVVADWIDAHAAPGFCIEFLSQPKPGANAARNLGLEAVSTPWTLFFDSDDVMLPGHLERVIQGIKDHPEADVLGWDVMGYAPDGSDRIQRFETQNAPWHNIMHGSMATQRYCARTDLFRTAGGWDETLSTWDDIELATRILSKKPCLVKLRGEPLVKMFRSEQSITGPSFAASADNCCRALKQMARVYPRLGPISHVAMKAVILAADSVRDGRADAVNIFKEALRTEPRAFNRMAYRLAYRWRMLGLRGAARVFKPLLR